MMRDHQHRRIFRTPVIAMVVVILALLRISHSAFAFTFVSQAKLGNRSIAGPSVTVGNGHVYMAFAGTNSRHTINVATSSDGMSFSTVQVGSNTSPFAPAITFFNGQVYVAWTGTNNNQLNIAWGDGTNFPNQATFPSMTALGGPGLGVANGQLYLAWMGTESPNLLHIASSPVASSFPVPTTIHLVSNDGPNPGVLGSLAVLGVHAPQILGPGDLVFVVFTFAASKKVELVTSQGGGNFSSVNTSQIASPTGPGLWFDGARLLLATLGPDQQFGLTLEASPLVPGQFPLNGIRDSLANNNRGISNPAVIAFDNRLFYYWTGDNPDHNLNVMQLIP